MEKPRSCVVEKRNVNASLPRSPPVIQEDTRQISQAIRNPIWCPHTSLESLVFAFSFLPIVALCSNKLEHDIFSQSFGWVVYDLAGLPPLSKWSRETEGHITIIEQTSLSSLKLISSGGDRSHTTLMRCRATSYISLRCAASGCWKR